MFYKFSNLRKMNEDGFTLIELLIVVIIIGILSAIAIPIFLNQQKAAIAGTVKSDVRNNISTVLPYFIKSPSTAVNIVKVGAATATGNGSTLFPLVVSDASTTMRVYSAAGVLSISASNSKIGAGEYTFYSDMGTYEGWGALL